MEELANTTYTQEQSIAYEAACECINQAIAILMSHIYQEEKASKPNSSWLLSLNEEVDTLWKRRNELKVNDAAEIQAIRNIFGERIRAYRQSNGQKKWF